MLSPDAVLTSLRRSGSFVQPPPPSSRRSRLVAVDDSGPPSTRDEPEVLPPSPPLAPSRVIDVYRTEEDELVVDDHEEPAGAPARPPPELMLADDEPAAPPTRMPRPTKAGASTIMAAPTARAPASSKALSGFARLRAMSTIMKLFGRVEEQDDGDANGGEDAAALEGKDKEIRLHAELVSHLPPMSTATPGELAAALLYHSTAVRLLFFEYHSDQDGRCSRADLEKWLMEMSKSKAVVPYEQRLIRVRTFVGEVMSVVQEKDKFLLAELDAAFVALSSSRRRQKAAALTGSKAKQMVQHMRRRVAVEKAANRRVVREAKFSLHQRLAGLGDASPPSSPSQSSRLPTTPRSPSCSSGSAPLTPRAVLSLSWPSGDKLLGHHVDEHGTSSSSSAGLISRLSSDLAVATGGGPPSPMSSKMYGLVSDGVEDALTRAGRATPTDRRSASMSSRRQLADLEGAIGASRQAMTRLEPRLCEMRYTGDKFVLLEDKDGEDQMTSAIPPHMRPRVWDIRDLEWMAGPRREQEKSSGPMSFHERAVLKVQAHARGLFARRRVASMRGRGAMGMAGRALTRSMSVGSPGKKRRSKRSYA